MASYHTGEAVINQYLQIIKADEKFYEYVGSKNYSALNSTVHPDDLPVLKDAIEGLTEGGRAIRLLMRMMTGDDYHYVLADLARRLAEQNFMYYTVHFQDLDALEGELAKLYDENQILNEYVGLLGDTLFLYDISRDYLKIFTGEKKSMIYLFRGSLEDFRADMRKREAVVEKDREVFELFCRNLQNGTKFFEHKLLFLNKNVDSETDTHLVKGRTVTDSQGNPMALGCIYMQKNGGIARMESNLASLDRDVTTGLLAKKSVIEYARNLLETRPKHKVNICIIDIDNFKQVNDTLGHMFGDEVLATVADILKDAAIDKGVAGRIGGDEMMLVLEGINDIPDLKGVLRSIRSNVEWAYKERKEVPRVTCSMGVSTYPTDGCDYDELFQIADKMLYRAKEKGKNRYIIYNPAVHGDHILQRGEALEPVTGESRGSSRQDRENLVLELIEYLGRKLNSPLKKILQDVGSSFELDGIYMFYGNIGKVTLENAWEAVPNEEQMAESSIEFVREENFHLLYKEHGMAVIDNFGILEAMCPETYAYMTGCGIKAALIYKMNCQKHEGYILYYKKSDTSRKWSDSDRAGLTYISKILELIIGDR